MPSFATKPQRRPGLSWAAAEQEVLAVVERLRQIWVERLPWDELVRVYDRPDTFFYLDPPYRCAAATSYRHFFTDEDHARLADALIGRVRGKWLLSYNDDPLIRQLYRGRQIHAQEVIAPYSVSRSGPQRVRELLISNYQGGTE